jgi:uncharacterized protein (DUF1015 family)
MWILDTPQEVTNIEKQLSQCTIYIADGHHRYETALDLRNEMMKNHPSQSGREPYNYVLMYLVNIADNGLSILPTHRLIKDFPSLTESGRTLELQILDPLREHFDITTIEKNGDIVADLQRYKHAIGLAIHGSSKGYLLRQRGITQTDLPDPLKELDVILLHELILKGLFKIQDINYEMDPELTLNEVRSGNYRAAFFLNPTRVEEVEGVALECLRMPPKSTYFYPKIPTGIVLNWLDK